MSMLDDYGNPLDMSASPGLATLPAQDQAPVDESAGLAVSPSVSDRSTFASPAAPTDPGLGMAASYKASRTNDDQEYLKSLPAAQKLGLLLQSYQAGVEGRANPFEQVLAQKQKREAEFRAEIGTTIQTIKGGVDLVKSMPPGKARDALIEQLTRAAGPSGGIVRDALMAAGTDNEKSITDIVSVIENPAAQAMLVAAAAKSADPRKEALRLISDSDFMKRLEQRADQTTLPGVTAKLSVVVRAMDKMPEFRGEDGKSSFTMAQLREQNAKLPKELQLTDAELGTANRNQAALITYGLKTDKTQQDEQSADAKRREEGPHTAIGKANRDLKNGVITTKEYLAEIRRINLSVEKKDGAEDAGGLTPDAVKTLAKEAAKDRSVLANIGRGAQGAKDLRAVLNQMSEDAKEGGASIADTRASYAADKKSLDKIVPQYDAVTAFENNAIAQGKVLVKLADKVDTTGSPVIERWIRAGRKSVQGDPDVAEFNAQMQLYRAEAAKILTNPNLTGVLTDTARKEVQDFLSENASAEQIKRVVSRLETDFGMRRKSFEDQIDVIKTRMAGGKKPTESAAPAPAAPPAGGIKTIKTDAEYNALPSDTEFIGPDGKKRKKP